MQESSTDNPMRSPLPGGPPDRDVLVSRLLDGRASETDWRWLRDLAIADASVWTDLATGCRVTRAVERGLADATATLGEQDVPNLRMTGGLDVHWSGRSRLGGLLGWAVAAALALGFVAQQAGLNPAPAPSTQAGLGPVAMTPGELLEQYLDAGRKSGRVVTELPQQPVIETRPLESGQGHEVLFIRQIVERTWVDNFQRVGMNEKGDPVLFTASAPGITKTKY